jgi:hypothetical protein
MTAGDRIGHTAPVLVLTLPLLLALASDGAQDKRCEAINTALEKARGGDVGADAGAIARVVSLLPGAFADRAENEAGRTDHAGVVDLVARATALTCPPVGPGERPTGIDLDSAGLQALKERDPRFGGLRADGSLSDRLLEKLWRFLQGLLESETMQRFSEHTRTIYLSMLAAFGSVLAFRLWRRKGRRAGHDVGDDVVVGVERVRREAFDRCRSEGVAVIDDDPRAALLHLRRALLARVGEIDEGAVTPSRTSRELLLRLPVEVADVVGPPLACFDDAFFGGHSDVASARAMLVAVDAAHEVLKGMKPVRRSVPVATPASSSSSSMRVP